MQEENMNPEQSLQIIQNMINRAQNNFSENGFLYIFWGWLVFIASVSFYIMLQMHLEYAGIVWMLMPMGGIFTGIYVAMQRKKEKVKSYMDEYVGYVWIAFGISLLITLLFGSKLQLGCYPMVIMLYAIATFITGGMLRFKPLVICGALSFPISVCAFFVTFDQQVLLLALSVLVSYIIPGHLLKSKFKQNN